MLASITPLGERGRNRRWGVSASSFVLGSSLGGLVVGAVAGAVGALLRAMSSLVDADVGTRSQLAVLLVALLAALAIDLRPGHTHPPGPRRQVNEDWLEIYRGWVYGAGFGLQLGAAVITQVATAAVWVMLLAAALTGSVAAGAVIGLVFGLVRALPVLTTRTVHDTSSLRALHRRSAALAGPVRWMTAGTLGAAGAVVGVLLVTAGGSSA